LNVLKVFDVGWRAVWLLCACLCGIQTSNSFEPLLAVALLPGFACLVALLLLQFGEDEEAFVLRSLHDGDFGYVTRSILNFPGEGAFEIVSRHMRDTLVTLSTAFKSLERDLGVFRHISYLRK
jgi:hypothetical protein